MEQEQKQHSNGDRGFENVELGIIGKKKKIPRRTGQQLFLLMLFTLAGCFLHPLPTGNLSSSKKKLGTMYFLAISKMLKTTLTWGPYLWFQMLRVATSTLSVCDFLGEKIASVLGISTPKYQYAIDEYYRMKKEVKHHCIYR
ncbi:protein FAM177A1 isoform A [Alligator mississippiensis]|uniref:Protein FAM177A1 isoform A n=1 Tax=Alligator mississippiensis TaxID=8496 RepID=A0A151NKD5_ALLMI|nr:protein FAM177A1 isoform A [Alligator mississippiensis]